MIYYPMRSGIVKIQITQNKDALRNKCANSALWLWDKGLMSSSGLSVYTPAGIVTARKEFINRLSELLDR